MVPAGAKEDVVLRGFRKGSIIPMGILPFYRDRASPFDNGVSFRRDDFDVSQNKGQNSEDADKDGKVP